MPSELLLPAAEELDRRAETLTGDVEQFVVGRELVELAARLRHAARWLDRPAGDLCRCQQAVAAAPAIVEKPRSLNKAQAAELLSLSTRTIDRLVKAGDLHPMKRGRVVRYDRGELERYLQSGQVAGAEDVG